MTSDSIMVVCTDAATARRALAAAAVPSRLHVCLCEDVPTLERELALDGSKIKRCFPIVDAGISLGRAPLRHQIISKLFLREPYVAFLGDGLHPVQNWDSLALSELAGAERNGMQCVTQHPLQVKAPGDAAHVEHGTYPVFSRFRDRVPEYRARRLQLPTARYRNMHVSASLLFGPSAQLLGRARLYRHPVPMISPVEDDWVITVQLWLEGVACQGATTLLAVHVPASTSTSTSASASGVNRHQREVDFMRETRTHILQHMCRDTWRDLQVSDTSVPAILRVLPKDSPHSVLGLTFRLGLDLWEQRAAGHSILGVSKVPTDGEITDKYGSRREFNAACTRFNIVI